MKNLHSHIETEVIEFDKQLEKIAKQETSVDIHFFTKRNHFLSFLFIHLIHVLFDKNEDFH